MMIMMIMFMFHRACGSARFRKTLKNKQGSDRYPYQNTSPNHGVTTFSSSRKRKDYHGGHELSYEDEKRQSRQRRFQLQSESPRNRVTVGLVSFYGYRVIYMCTKERWAGGG